MTPLVSPKFWRPEISKSRFFDISESDFYISRGEPYISENAIYIPGEFFVV